MPILRDLVSEAVHFVFGRHSSRIKTSFTSLDIPELQECRALIVNEVDEKLLLGSINAASQRIHDALPVRMLNLSLEDISKAAVLSWRWDGELRCLGSKNVAAAVRQSKRMGIEYLFIDAISIDQNLRSNDLIRQVMAFSTLYRTIQVIAAYDKDDELFKNTMYRPWIYAEACLYRYNPRKIVYVGHHDRGGASIWRFFPKNELDDYRFVRQLESVWNGSYIETINGVLCGDIGMKYIYDFRFIIPVCAKPLVAAYQTMSHNDYLLTALLLCRNYTSEEKVKLQSNTRANIFHRYSFRKVDGPGSGRFWGVYGIFLDGVRVGDLEGAGRTRSSFLGTFIAVRPDSEDIILSCLGFKSSERKEYAANAEARRAYFDIGIKSAPLPEIEVVSVEF